MLLLTNNQIFKPGSQVKWCGPEKLKNKNITTTTTYFVIDKKSLTLPGANQKESLDFIQVGTIFKDELLIHKIENKNWVSTKYWYVVNSTKNLMEIPSPIIVYWITNHSNKLPLQLLEKQIQDYHRQELEINNSDTELQASNTGLNFAETITAVNENLESDIVNVAIPTRYFRAEPPVPPIPSNYWDTTTTATATATTARITRSGFQNAPALRRADEIFHSTTNEVESTAHEAFIPTKFKGFLNRQPKLELIKIWRKLCSVSAKPTTNDLFL